MLLSTLDRIKNKMDSWYNKYLSQAGKEVLLKAVITALPTYSMSCYMLPKGLIREITAYMKRFWWSSIKDKNKIAWVSWRKITRSKKRWRIRHKRLGRFQHGTTS